MIDKIYLHTGPVDSGKSTEIENQLQTQLIAHGYNKVAIFRPKKDTRSFDNHNNVKIFRGQRLFVTDASELVQVVREKRLSAIGIDEVQFFSPKIVDILYELFREGRRITVGGLDYDFRGEAFETTKSLMICPEVKVFKRKAACVICDGRIGATRSVRIDLKNRRVLTEGPKEQVGGIETYRAVCYNPHFLVAMDGGLSNHDFTRLVRNIEV